MGLPKTRPGDPPTDKQAAVRDYVAGHWREHGYAPTFREIADHFGMAVNAAEGVVRALRAKGILAPAPPNSHARTIRLSTQEAPK